MSGTSNINNSVYKFELALVNTKSGEEIYLPIPKGAVEYLEIEDSLANFGLVGLCKISNFYSILQQLKVMDVTGINCMYISIKNMDFAKDDNPKTSIDFLSLITKNTETSKNIIDKSVNFKFEDYFIARTRMESIIETNINLSTVGTPGELIFRLFKLSNAESVVADTDVSFISNGDIADKLVILEDDDIKVSISSFYEGDKVKSIYDLITELYKYCSYPEHGPAVISTTNIIDEGGEKKRKITLRPFSSYISGFYDLYSRKEIDLSKYVTEEFIVGDASSSSALNTNFIDSFEFIRVDQGDVLANKWIDYIIPGSGTDITKTEIGTVLYTKTKEEFSRKLLSNYSPNLPDRDSEKNINTQVVNKRVGLDNILITKYVQNALMKSFIYDNTAITFTVQGNTYREAGKFIRIKSKDLNDGSSDPETKSVDGYWFILSVKHIFKGDFYTNEYVCVKLHSGGPSQANTPLLDPRNLPNRSPSRSQIFGVLSTQGERPGGEPELPSGDGVIEDQDILIGPKTDSEASGVGPLLGSQTRT